VCEEVMPQPLQVRKRGRRGGGEGEKRGVFEHF
jgi:hypothetical protein